MKKITQLFLISTILIASIFADPFNSKLTEDERATISTGEIIIKNINYEKNICLKKGVNPLGDKLLEEINHLNPNMHISMEIPKSWMTSYNRIRAHSSLMKHYSNMLNPLGCKHCFKCI